MKKSFKIFFILFSFIINYQFLYAQVNLEWAREYYYNYSDNKAKCIAVDNDGNSAVTGTVLGSGIDIVTLRYNSGGNLLWSRIYTNANQYNSDDGVSDIVVDKQRNIYITGYTANSVSANRNIITIKYSPSGDSLWVKHYAGTANGNDEGKAIALDNSGNVYVTGYSTGTGTNADYITIKYDSLGNQIWVNSYNYFTNNADISNSIDVDERGNVYVTGQSEYSYLTIKYDSNGNLKWDKRYNAGNSIGISLEADIYGNVYVTGTSRLSGGSNNEDYATIKYDSLGNILWSKRYNSNGIDNAVGLKLVNSINVNSPPDIIVTGTSSNDYFTIKYSGVTGNTLWSQRYNGPSNSLEAVSSLAVDDFGNAYVTGYSYDNVTGNDIVTIKYDGIFGDELWNVRYNTSGNTNERGKDIALGPDGSVFVTGEYNPFTNIFKTIKYKEAQVQVSDSVWRYNTTGFYNNNLENIPYAMEIDVQGNIYITGESERDFWTLDQGRLEVVTIKYNPEGNILWENNLFFSQGNQTGIEINRGIDIDFDISGNVYVLSLIEYWERDGYTGQEEKFNFPGIIKYDSLGNVIWSRVSSYPGINSKNTPISMLTDDSGNVYIQSELDHFNETCVIKYNSNGDREWFTDYYQAPGIPCGFSFDKFGNIISASSENGEIQIQILNQDGIVILNKNIQFFNNRYFNGTMTLDNSGNIYFAGGDDNYSSDDYYIIKLDSNVNLEWTRSFDKNGESDYATSLKTDKHGNLFVTGYTTENEITSMTTLKYNTNGYLLWSKSEGQYSGGNDLELDMYGNAYATGFITESGSSQNYLTVKYNTNGDSLWNKKYNGTRNHRDISKIVALDINGNLYITGQSIGLGTGAYHDDIVTIKYSEAYSLNSTLNLTSIIEGFYNEDLNTMVSDTVQIFLRSVTSPYSVVDSAKSVLDISGNGTFDFSNTDVDTPYYIIVKHRNSIETWSSIGQSFTSNQLSYNFTENSDKAYGSNLVLKGNKYCIYSGDVNEDGYIDLSDVITINNDVIDFVTGYNLTDINGDNQSDLSDLITAYNNSLNFVSMKRP